MTATPIRLSEPQDLAAAVPTLLGFHPSVGDGVLVVFIGRRVELSLRVTMTDVSSEEVAYELARSVRRGVPDATRAVLVGYSASEHPPLNLAGALWRAGLNVEDVLRVHDGQVTCRNGCTHPLPEDLARPAAVAAGLVVRGSRDELYELVGHTGAPLSDAENDVAGRLSEPWQRDRLIGDLVTVPVEDLPVYREVYLRIARSIEPGDLRRDGALCLAAIASYLAGDAAVANVALDAVTPGYRLAMLLRAAIGHAIPPTELREAMASFAV